MLRRTSLALLAAVVLSSVAHGQGVQPRIALVASMSILADFAREVGGERVEVVSLVGPNADVHGFEPSPADARRLAEARLVVVNGLGLEGWLPRLVKASGTKALVVESASGVSAMAGEHEHGGQAAARRDDPHAWQDVHNAKVYVENIRAALARVDPDGAATYGANARRYAATLDALDRDIRNALAVVPPSRREIITTHDAFGYFGHAYGLRFTAPQGVSTESEASAADIARIIRQVKARKIRAVFLENISDPRLAERIAREGGARVGEKVYSDALSPADGPAATYVAMMRHNLRAFLATLSD